MLLQQLQLITHCFFPTHPQTTEPASLVHQSLLLLHPVCPLPVLSSCCLFLLVIFQPCIIFPPSLSISSYRRRVENSICLQRVFPLHVPSKKRHVGLTLMNSVVNQSLGLWAVMLSSCRNKITQKSSPGFNSAEV